MKTRPQQMIRVGDHQVALPQGVTVSQWALEKSRWQNPRIRSLLGSIRLLEGVLESNYAILHCSPARLHEIWRKVRQVTDLIRSELGLLLEPRSVIPRLERARQSIQGSLEMLDSQVLRDFDRFPSDLPRDRLIDVRKLLCVSIGKLHAFLQDTVGELLAADPRSLHDADYFLSKRFPRDIEEAEWLYLSVHDFKEFLADLEAERGDRLTEVTALIRRTQGLPSARGWSGLREFLTQLIQELTPRLNEMLALRGIRFYEMEILDQYAREIPTKARLAIELGDTGLKAVESLEADLGETREQQEQSLRGVGQLSAVLGRRLIALLSEIDRSLQDLWVFIPIWQQNIEKRRALLLRRDEIPQAIETKTVA